MVNMVKAILFSKFPDSWRIPIYKRLFYRLKALICCALNLEPLDFRSWDYTYITVCYTDGGQAWSEYGTNYWYERIIVGSGLFRNWWCIYDQGSSE